MYVLCSDGVLRKDMTNSNFPLFESLGDGGLVQGGSKVEAIPQFRQIKDSHMYVQPFFKEF